MLEYLKSIHDRKTILFKDEIEYNIELNNIKSKYVETSSNSSEVSN
jgi:hypothetical protein